MSRLGSSARAAQRRARAASGAAQRRGEAPGRPGGVDIGIHPPRASDKNQSSKPLIKRPLSPLQAAGAKSLIKYQERLVAKARSIMDSALRAQETKKDVKGTPPQGFASWHDFRVAKDALKPKRESPVYLDIAARTVEADAKLNAVKAERAPLNLQVMTYVQGAPPEAAMKVIEVKA